MSVSADSDFEIEVQKEITRHLSEVNEELSKIGIKPIATFDCSRHLGGENNDLSSRSTDSNGATQILSGVPIDMSNMSDLSSCESYPDESIYMKIMSQFEENGDYRRDSMNISQQRVFPSDSTLTEEKVNLTQSKTTSLRELRSTGKHSSRISKSFVDNTISERLRNIQAKPSQAARPSEKFEKMLDKPRDPSQYGGGGSATLSSSGSTHKSATVCSVVEKSESIQNLREKIVDVDGEYKNLLNEWRYLTKNMTYLSKEMDCKRGDIQKLMRNVRDSKDCADERRKAYYRLRKELDCVKANYEMYEKSKGAAEQDLQIAQQEEKEMEDSLNRIKNRLEQEMNKKLNMQKGICDAKEKMKNLEKSICCTKNNLQCLNEKVGQDRCANVEIQNVLHHLRLQCNQLQKLELNVSEGIRCFGNKKLQIEARVNELRLENQTLSKKIEESSFEAKREAKRLKDAGAELTKQIYQTEKLIRESEAKLSDIIGSIQRISDRTCCCMNAISAQKKENSFLKPELQRFKAEIVATKNQLAVRRKAYKKLQSQIENYMKDVASRKAEVETLNARIEAEKESFCTKKGVLDEKLIYERQSICAAKDGLRCKERVLGEFHCKTDELTHELKCLEKAINSQREDVKDLRLKIEFQEKKTNSLKQEISIMENTMAGLQNDIDSKRQLVQRLLSNIEVVGFKEKEVKCDITFVTQDIERVAVKLNNDIQTILNVKETLVAKWDNCVASLQNKEFALTCRFQEMENLVGQLKSLKSMVKSKESQLSSIKAAIVNMQSDTDNKKRNLQAVKEDYDMVRHKILQATQNEKRLASECEDLEMKIRRNHREHKEMRAIFEEDIREQCYLQTELNKELNKAYRKLQDEFNSKIAVEREKMRQLQKQFDEKDAKLTRVVQVAKRTTSKGPE